jgi:hypothetical protein
VIGYGSERSVRARLVLPTGRRGRRNLGPMLRFFKNTFAKKINKTLAFMTLNIMQKYDQSTVFFRKMPFLSPKIGENRRKL